MITLITMAQGNIIALKRTIESFQDTCPSVVIGNLCIFEDDIAAINNIATHFPKLNIKVVDLEFNYIYKHGFAAVLNTLAQHVETEFAMYMNVGEITTTPILEVSNEYNTYFFNHAEEKHHWYRCYKPKELKWSGVIHEEVTGNKRPCPKVMFTMADTPKDSTNDFKASVYNDIKEIVYFNQYLRLVNDRSCIGSTNMGWVDYAKQNYNHIKDRLLAKGDRYNAFVNSDIELYLNEIHTNGVPDQFDNNKIIHFQ